MSKVRKNAFTTAYCTRLTNVDNLLSVLIIAVFRSIDI